MALHSQPLRRGRGLSGLPTGALGRSLAAGILVLLIGATCLGIVLPIAAWFVNRGNTLADRATLAQRMAQVAATLPAVEQAAQARATPEAAQELVLSQNSDSLAGAAFLQAVQDMAARSGTTLSTTEILPPEAVGSYRRIRLRIALSASYPMVVAFLQSIDGAKPRMLVDALQLRAAPVLVGQESGPVEAAMTITAFRAGAATQ